MRVHNLTKDLVIQKVKEVFSQKEDLVHRGFCISPQCELDVVCFVLNRMPPEYVVSGRGMAHVEQDYRKNSQKITDIVALINEGLEVVTRNQRPRGNTEPSEEQLGYFWNFPSIIGRLFNGLNFEPIPDTEVFLLSEGVPVRVIDPNWQNPYKMVINTAGTFLFWPHPLRAEAPGMTRNFSLEIRVNDDRYEALNHFFEIELTSEEVFIDFVNTVSSHRLKDLYLFPAS